MSIEERIDDTIADWENSRDAMRWTPDVPGMTEYGNSGTAIVFDPDVAMQVTIGGPLPPLPEECYPPDAEPLPVYRLAPDEIELLESIRRDRSWWRRLARRFRRSSS